MFNIFKSKNNLENDRLTNSTIKISKEGLNFLCKNYREPSNQGKVEVLIHNSILAMSIISNNISTDLYNSLGNSVAKRIEEEAKILGVKRKDFIKFIFARYEYFHHELLHFDKGPTNTLPSRSYTAVYVSPLSTNIDHTAGIDVFEIMNFSIKGLFPMKNIK